MNDTLKTLLARRSIRKYKEEQISEEELMTILEAGQYAPSAMNQQPWHFTVIQNREMLVKLNEVCVTALINTGNKYFEERAKKAKFENINITYGAPTLIFVSGDEKAIAPINDCSLALENMFLAAQSLGIGSCWLNAFNHLFATEEGKAYMLKESIVPEGYKIIGTGAFGYKGADDPSPAPRRADTLTIIK